MTKNEVLNFLAWVWKIVKICFIPNPEVNYIEIPRYQPLHHVKGSILYQLLDHWLSSRTPGKQPCMIINSKKL